MGKPISKNFDFINFCLRNPRKDHKFRKNINHITSKNIPEFVATFLLVSIILSLAFGSILFISGFKQGLGSTLLLMFIIPKTFILHFFPFQVKTVLMNAGLIGGLLLGLNKVKRNSLKDIFNNQTRKIRNLKMVSTFFVVPVQPNINRFLKINFYRTFLRYFLKYFKFISI